jgi:MFS family permease
VTEPKPRPELLQLFALPGYRAYAFARSANSVASTLLQALLAWQLYALTGSALDLGGLGLVRFVPSLAASFISGPIIDTYNRRTILFLAQLVPATCAAVMLGALGTENVSVFLIYGIALATGVATTFENPTRSAILPSLVPGPLLPRAITANSTLQSLAFSTGPVVAGFALEWGGERLTYIVYLVLLGLALFGTAALPSAPPREKRSGVTLAAVGEGLQYLGKNQPVLGAMLLDLFAVILAGAKGLLPVYAVDVLQVGAAGYGLLNAAMEVGTLVTSVALLTLPLPKATGKALVLSVMAFGLATVVFGASTWFPLSLLAYALVGAADQMSVVLRTSIVLLSTPDYLRGRVSAVNSVFISSSNNLAAVESGAVAALTNVVFAVVSGGIGCIAIAATIGWRMPQLWRYRMSDHKPD